MQLDDSYSSESLSYNDDDEDYQPFSLSDNDFENDKFIGQKSLKNLPLSTQVKQYFQKFKKTNTKSFLKLFNFKDQVPEHKSVCAKSINHGDTIAQCYDCATDSTCIQCIECFKNSNHQGHKVIIKKAYGGCCDCGDLEAWKKQGFCTKHTGQIIDIQIDPKEEEDFVSQMKQLFFLMFWESIQENTNNCREYSQKLLQSLCYLNQKGVYYNKLTCLVFGSKIPQNLIVSNNVNSRTILGNILSPKVAKNLNIDEWMDLFFYMFQYYPFKKLLLSTYIKNFSIIYCDEESEMRGSSIACQLMTSYQLVREYALEEGSVPLGSDIKINKITSFERPFGLMYHDLEYIIKLSGDTPQVYFRFHMRNKEGILKLFEYRKVIKQLQDKEKEEPDILQLARFVKNFQLQFKALELVSKIAGILQQDKETLEIVIKILYEEALKQESERKMIIFKPLTRALTIFLFAYFDLDLKNLDYGKNQEKIERFLKIFNSGEEQFGNSISKIFKVCVESFLFHAKTLAEPGLNSTLYVYIYLYKMKDRLISSVDILGVKMFSIFHNWPEINKLPVISPQDYFWQSKVSVTEQARKQELESKIQNLKFILMELNLVTASESNELYVAYDINSDCTLYQNYIEYLLPKILNQQKTSVTLALAKQYQESFFHKNVDLAHNYLKKFCNFDKNKKAFVLTNQLPQTQSDTLNYSDFRCNLTNKNEFQSPQKTLNLIRFSKSQHIFDSLWSIQTIKKFVVKVIEFVKAFQTSTSLNSPDSFVEKFNPLFIQLIKVIYIKKMLTKNPEELNIVLEFLRKIQNIDKLINPFYETLINPSKMQEEKAGNEMDEEKRESPKKPVLQSKNCQDQRKKALKQKMEQKKKAIKERYAKQLAQFQKEEKNKLEKEEELEQTEHKLNCIICKNQNQEDLVYFAHISFRNHEKLLNLGNGVSCLSVQSCYHSVDFACYSKLASEVGNKKRPTIKCPFCKFRSNTFFPVLSQSKLSVEAIKKFEVAIFLQKNVDQISVVEEVIKSFYHFSLLAYLDPQRTLHRRLKIYRIILEILQANSKVYLVSDVYKKFITKTMNLNPKVLEEKNEIERSEQMLQLSMFLQNSSDDIRMEDLSEDQIELLLNIIGQRGNNQSQHNNQGNVFGTLVNKIKEKITFSLNKSQQQTKEEQKYTPIFKSTLMRVFNFLGFKDAQITHKNSEQMEQKPSQNSQNVSMVEQELSPQLEMCLKNLFEQKTSHLHQISIYENFNDNNGLLKLRDLPINFRPLGRLNKCHFCDQISPSITICLLCDWQGCLKDCLKGEKIKKMGQFKEGGSFNHSKVHGEESLFLLMQKCYVARINSEGSCETLGCIYKDEWGNDFNNKEKWENFFLDEGELSKLKLGFLHDQ